MRVISPLLAFGAIAWGVVAGAHPMHEVVQNAYLTLSPGKVAMQLELTAGPQVSDRVLGALDHDRDRRIRPAEAWAYADRVLAMSRLTIDGRPLVLRTVAADVPTYAAIRGAHGTIRIKAEAVQPERAGAHVLTYRNGYTPAESRCDANVFLSGGSVRYRIARQDRSRDGRVLTVRYLSRLD